MQNNIRRKARAIRRHFVRFVKTQQAAGKSGIVRKTLVSRPVKLQI